MSFSMGPPQDVFEAFALAGIVYNGPVDTWHAFETWCEESVPSTAPHSALCPAPYAYSGSRARVFHFADLPRVRAWWREHGGEAVQACVSFEEPYGMWSDHPVFTVDLTPEARVLVGDALFAEASFGPDWKARVRALAKSLEDA